MCECDHLGHFAVLMEQQTVPIVIHLPAFHVEIIVGAVISVFLLVTCLVLFKVGAQLGDSYKKLKHNFNFSLLWKHGPWTQQRVLCCVPASIFNVHNLKLKS